jgi:uncharacterized membrane protein YwzB
MKQKWLYVAGALVLIGATMFALQAVELDTFFEEEVDPDAPIDMSKAPKAVTTTIEELKLYRPHLSETCLYGAAMMLNNLGDDAKSASDSEGKCIHTLVIFIAREKKMGYQKVHTKPAQIN